MVNFDIKATQLSYQQIAADNTLVRPKPRPDKLIVDSPHVADSKRSQLQLEGAGKAETSIPLFGTEAVDYDAIYNTPLSPDAKELYDAILAYPTDSGKPNVTPKEAHAIALITFQAARDFKIGPKLMLAIFAHESQGFQTDAKSSTGAGGLGQLTNSAIDETRRLSYDPSYKGKGKAHYPRADIREKLESDDMRAVFRRIDQNRKNRNDIHDNIWTSTAYTRIMFDRVTKKGGTVSVKSMLERYNAAGGIEQRRYPGAVGKAFKALFGQEMPTTLRNIP